MIEYSLTRADILTAFVAFAAQSPRGRLPGAGIYGGPRQQVGFLVKSGMFLPGARRVWADDEGLHEQLDGVEQVFRWPAVEPTIDLGDFLAVPLAGLGADVPAFSAFALLIPRATPGLAELRATLDARAAEVADFALPMPGEQKGADPLAELEDDVLPEDYHVVNRASLRSPIGVRSLAIAVVAGLATGVVIGLVLASLSWFPFPAGVSAVFGAAVGALAFTGLVLVTMRLAARNLVDSGVYKIGPGAWWFDRERFSEEIGGRQYVVDWAKIDRIQQADGVAMLWLSPAFAILVPCRDDRGRAFVAALERHLGR